MAVIKLESSKGFTLTETALQTVTNNASLVTLFSQVIPGNSMGVAKQLDFRLLMTIATGLVPPTFTMTLNMGGSSLIIYNAVSLVASISTSPFIVEGTIINMASASSQSIFVKTFQNTAAVPIVSVGSVGLAQATMAVDTTQSQTMSFTCQFATASSSTTLNCSLISLALS